MVRSHRRKLILSAGHRIGHDRLDVFPAFGAIVTMDRMLGDHLLSFFGNVLDGACAFTLASLQRTTAAGTAFETVCFLSIDLDRAPAPSSLQRIADTARGSIDDVEASSERKAVA